MKKDKEKRKRKRKINGKTEKEISKLLSGEYLQNRQPQQ
tara:strand:+ start:391 stop:507 length:117 start_codon:yes stop_codon:yes gene_type:complete